MRSRTHGRELDVAVEAAMAAGEILLGHFREGVTVRWKGDRDPVTVADEQAQQAVREVLLGAFPDDLVVGEEGQTVAEAQVQGRRRWYVDPLDGTTNFMRGRRRWATSVALCDASDRMMVAAVRAPCWEETYVAIRGEGATCDGRTLESSSVAALDEVLLAVGAFGAEGPASREAVAMAALEVLSVRVTGSTVCDLCDLAAGRADAFWAGSAGRWDLAAGALLAVEAGAVATDLAGAPVSGPAETLLASAPQVHARLLELLRDAG